MEDIEPFENRLKSYPLNDLLDIKAHIDREKYPGRYAILLEEINRRYASGELLVTKEKGKYQTGVRRFWAAIIDGLILLGVGFLGGLLLIVSPPGLLHTLIFIIFAWLSVAYAIYLHGRYGQTIGKMAVGVVVLDISESRLSMKQAIVRDIVPVVVTAIATLADLSPYFGASQLQPVLRPFVYDNYFILLGWDIVEVLTMLTNPKRRAVHDFIAGSVVVNKEALKPKMIIE